MIDKGFTVIPCSGPLKAIDLGFDVIRQLIVCSALDGLRVAGVEVARYLCRRATAGVTGAPARERPARHRLAVDNNPTPGICKLKSDSS